MTAEAFKEKILPLNGKLLGFALRYMKDMNDAKDIVQDIYIKLWNMRTALDKYNSVEALAMRMTRNLCLDKIKLNKTVPLNGYNKENIENNHYNHEMQEELSLAVKRVKNIIYQLDEPQKSIILLRDIEGYDYEEIAQIMSMNVNSIRVSISRSRKKIRDILYKKYYNHESGKNKSSIREIL